MGKFLLKGLKGKYAVRVNNAARNMFFGYEGRCLDGADLNLIILINGASADINSECVLKGPLNHEGARGVWC